MMNVSFVHSICIHGSIVVIFIEKNHACRFFSPTKKKFPAIFDSLFRDEFQTLLMQSWQKNVVKLCFVANCPSEEKNKITQMASFTKLDRDICTAMYIVHCRPGPWQQAVTRPRSGSGASDLLHSLQISVTALR